MYQFNNWTVGIKNAKDWAFPGGPVAKTLHFHCMEDGFDPWSGSEDPTGCVVWPKKIFN